MNKIELNMNLKTKFLEYCFLKKSETITVGCVNSLKCQPNLNDKKKR